MAESVTRTVSRALDLLAAVCDAGGTNLAEAARATDLSSSTALRLLRTLESSGFVRRDDAGSFRPGLRLVQLGAQALSSESLVSLAEAPLRRLVEATGESCYLSVPHLQGTEHEQCIYLAMEEGTHSVRHASWVGRSFPMTGSAAGAALSGAVDEQGYTVVGQAVESDVTAVAAPIAIPPAADAEPQIVAALSVVAPSYRMTSEAVDRIGQFVAAEAAGILHARAVAA
ncbi:IclR family transcriptional regulator [Nesterenkonia sp. F]|uniref:IclR family transcriptional regulator n=1 Tax=Nesterenkonia sp. F TaxID=795955 RepID=UPI000255C868|nr:helix-turn-helix domain-containing protein [Nesterenkonia sp. F]